MVPLAGHDILHVGPARDVVTNAIIDHLHSGIMYETIHIKHLDILAYPLSHVYRYPIARYIERHHFAEREGPFHFRNIDKPVHFPS